MSFCFSTTVGVPETGLTTLSVDICLWSLNCSYQWRNEHSAHPSSQWSTPVLAISEFGRQESGWSCTPVRSNSWWWD